jgi:hypothetical protein
LAEAANERSIEVHIRSAVVESQSVGVFVADPEGIASMEVAG